MHFRKCTKIEYPSIKPEKSNSGAKIPKHFYFRINTSNSATSWGEGKDIK